MSKYIYECPNQATCGNVEYGNTSVPRNCPRCGQLMLPKPNFKIIANFINILFK